MKETETPENSSSEDDEVSNDNEPESQRAHETEHNSSTQHDEEGSVPDTIVTAEATDVACSIVKLHTLLRFECRVSFEKISLMILFKHIVFILTP